MIKHMPQEIADFFDCYVAMDKNGCWHGYVRRPRMREKGWMDDFTTYDVFVNRNHVCWQGDWKDSLHIPLSEKERLRSAMCSAILSALRNDAIRDSWSVHDVVLMFPDIPSEDLTSALLDMCGDGVIAYGHGLFTLTGSPDPCL